MKTTTETRLRTVALVLTAMVLLQLVWGGIKLLLTAEPEPTLPAEGSLKVDEIRQSAQSGEALSESLAARPLFWQGREKWVADPNALKIREPERAPRNSNIDEVALKGTFSAGEKSGVIVSFRDERRRLQRDEAIAGWTFTALSDEGATFKSGAETQVLALEHAKSVPMAKRQPEPEPEPAPDQSNAQDKAQDKDKKRDKADKRDKTSKQGRTNKQNGTGE